MAIADLVFIVSFLFCASMLIRLVWLAIRSQWARWRSTARLLGAFVAAYVSALATAGLSMPRHELAAGERKCFDDWCVAASGAEVQSTQELCPGSAAVWVASIEVSSVAKRIHQRAPDASIEVEDTDGKRYAPCAAGAGPRNIRDMLGPGESFSVSLPFGLPLDARPAGLVVHHGAFPGIIIVGDDQSWLHKPTLFRTSVH
jgi:hypothetical protein